MQTIAKPINPVSLVPGMLVYFNGVQGPVLCRVEYVYKLETVSLKVERASVAYDKGHAFKSTPTWIFPYASLKRDGRTIRPYTWTV